MQFEFFWLENTENLHLILQYQWMDDPGKPHADSFQTTNQEILTRSSLSIIISFFLLSQHHSHWHCTDNSNFLPYFFMAQTQYQDDKSTIKQALYMQEDARISNTDLLQTSRKGCSYCWLAHYLTFIYKHHALLQRPERNQPALAVKSAQNWYFGWTTLQKISNCWNCHQNQV